MVKSKPITYPFIPKSANWLKPGQFWALPLSDGSFGCAQVIEIPSASAGLGRMIFLAGLLDWHSKELPTSSSLKGVPCLHQGQAHIRAITRTGGQILGIRDLQTDQLEPWLFREALFSENGQIYKGLVPLRPEIASDKNLPVRGVWGYGFATAVAQKRFIGKA